MWLFGINKDGVNPCGTAHSHKTQYKSMRKWRELAAQMIRNNRNRSEYHEVCKVYAVADYTFEMGRMSNAEFLEHVKNKGVLVYG